MKLSSIRSLSDVTLLNPPKKAEGHSNAKSHVLATRLANTKEVVCYYVDADKHEAEEWSVMEYKVPQKHDAVFGVVIRLLLPHLGLYFQS